MSDDRRIHRLNDSGLRENGRFVLYWMHRAQRAAGNPALQHAIGLARRCDAAVLAAIVLPKELPDRYARHYAFMLQGLECTRRTLADRKIKLVALRGDPTDVLPKLAKDAIAVVADGGYLRQERAWRKELADTLDCALDWGETEIVVPIETASDKREYAARTIRRKINACRDAFITARSDRWPEKSALPLHVTGEVDLSDAKRALDALSPESSPGPVNRFRGGTDEARRHLTRFIRRHLEGYADARSDPARPRVSGLSPYLNYGQISPIEVAAMNEMLATGYMHNYMRMYRGKKILEWSNSPEAAFETALFLNNKYFLDGRNENSCVNVAWLFGLHDRAWTERPIFSKVRYMSAGGLESKFDIGAYVEWANALTPESET